MAKSERPIMPWEKAMVPMMKQVNLLFCFYYYFIIKLMDSEAIKLQNWLPLESNVEVLNNYLTTLGVQSDLVKFHDVYSFDEEGLAFVPQPIIGALFVYPDSKHINNYFFNEGDNMFKLEPPQSIYYMKQVAENACGTISLLHSLINVLEEYPFIVEPDSFVENFLNDTRTMNPEERAEYLNKCKTVVKKKDGTKTTLQGAHKEAANQEGEVAEDSKVYHHFISFIWKEGYLIELDGRKKGPIVYAKCEQGAFMEKVFEACIKHYVSKDEASTFGLMALSIGG